MQQELKEISKKFSDEYDKVYEAQKVESTFWEGLIDLKNKIWSTDYISTRDKSLHQLLDLLTLDDTVFMRQSFFEDTEARVKGAINAKLGAGTVEKLLAGGATLAIESGGVQL
jgi:3-oxoacyl-ACP reductase-like protein